MGTFDFFCDLIRFGKGTKIPVRLDAANFLALDLALASSGYRGLSVMNK